MNNIIIDIKLSDNLIFKLDFEKKVLLDGGVYMFVLLDGNNNTHNIYIGQTYSFYVRLQEHLFSLLCDLSYFGLDLLKESYTLCFKIINSNLPFIEKDTQLVSKRRIDKNLSERIKKEKVAIMKYQPLSQVISYNINKQNDSLLRERSKKLVNKIEIKQLKI